MTVDMKKRAVDWVLAERYDKGDEISSVHWSIHLAVGFWDRTEPGEGTDRTGQSRNLSRMKHCDGPALMKNGDMNFAFFLFASSFD
jgi:hypothetical protein